MNPDPPADRHETSAQSAESPAAGEYAYPSDLAALVLTRWHEATAAGQIDLPPPAARTLADVLSICYQATLLREEGRPVTFRLALSEPDAFEPAAGPPSGLHRLVFTRPLPFDQHELRQARARCRVLPIADRCHSAGGAPSESGVSFTRARSGCSRSGADGKRNRPFRPC